MKLKANRPFHLEGSQVAVGSVVDVDDELAARLTGAGYTSPAIEVGEPESSEEATNEPDAEVSAFGRGRRRGRR